MASGKIKTSTTVIKALHVLEAVGDSAQALNLAEIAHKVGIDRTTAYRLLTTLEVAGYVRRSVETKRYRLSHKVMTFGRNLLDGDERYDLIRSALRELSKSTQETASYAALDDMFAVLVMQSKGTQLVSVDFKVGDQMELHNSAVGKAILAHQSKEMIESVIAGGLPKTTENTITDPDRFRTALESIKQTGIAVDDGEFNDELVCIAAPIIEPGDQVFGGINFFGPRQRYTHSKLAELSTALTVASRNLSQQLGGLG